MTTATSKYGSVINVGLHFPLLRLGNTRKNIVLECCIEKNYLLNKDCRWSAIDRFVFAINEYPEMYVPTSKYISVNRIISWWYGPVKRRDVTGLLYYVGLRNSTKPM